MLPYEKSRALQQEKISRFEAEAARSRRRAESEGFARKALASVSSALSASGKAMRQRRTVRGAH